MTTPKIGKNKILILALLVVAVVGYFIFKGGGETVEPLTMSETGEAATISQELVIELNRLNALRNINDKFLKDPAFVSLQDYTQTVVPQPLGRSNPFAPIGGN